MAATIAKTKAVAIKKLQTLRVGTISKGELNMHNEAIVFKYEIDNKEILSIAIKPETEQYAKGYAKVYVPYPRPLKEFDFSSQVKLYQYRNQQAALDAAAQYALKYVQARK